MGGASQRSGSLAEKAARAVRRAAWPENAARRPCDKGFSGIGPSLSPLKCTGFRLIGGDGCPQCRALRPTGLARSPFDCTAFRVASGAGCPHPESACRALGAATLTVEIHSAASGLRRWISTWEIARFVGPTFALTVRIPWASTGCGGSCPRPDLHCLVTIRAPSPLKTTALRVFEWAGYPHGRALPDVWQRHASKGTDDGQSMPEAAHHPIGRRCSPSKYTVPRVVSADGYPHEHAHRRCSRSCART